MAAAALERLVDETALRTLESCGAPGLRKVGTREATSDDLDGWQPVDIENVAVDLHARKTVPQDPLCRLPPLAEILGLDELMGSIDVGKRADLIVTDGDPLQIVTNVERAFIDGVEVSLESKHTRLWRQFRERH